MNISLVPLDIYKVPKHCSDVLVAQNFLYTVQHIVSATQHTGDPVKNVSHAIGVVSGSFSNLNICEEAVIVTLILTFPSDFKFPFSNSKGIR